MQECGTRDTAKIRRNQIIYNGYKKSEWGDCEMATQSRENKWRRRSYEKSLPFENECWPGVTLFRTIG